jgi:hypothetical protein
MEVPRHPARACDRSLAPEKRVPVSFPGSLAAGGWSHESGLAQGQIQASKRMCLASQQPGPAICGVPNAPLTIDPRLSALNPSADASKSSLASKPSTEEDAHSYSVTDAQRTHGNGVCVQ